LHLNLSWLRLASIRQACIIISRISPTFKFWGSNNPWSSQLLRSLRHSIPDFVHLLLTGHINLLLLHLCSHLSVTIYLIYSFTLVISWLLTLRLDHKHSINKHIFLAS
jgi:hypothetical protein